MKQSSLLSFFSQTPKPASGTPSPKVNGHGKSSGSSSATPTTSQASSKKSSSSSATTPQNGTPSSSKQNGNSTKSKRSSSAKSSAPTPSSGRRRIRVISSSSEDEYKPKGEEEEEEEEEEESGSGSGSDYSGEEEDESPQPKSASKSASKSSKSRAKSPQPKRAKLSSTVKPTKLTNNANFDMTMSGELDKWTHLSLEFLQPGNIRDINRKRPDHPEYNPRTLYVPDSFKKSVSPGLRQWWEMKSENYDTILFFKVGKFYELYHMDAVTGVQELGITYMKGEVAHCGFPEISYSRFASVLIEKGYKVARIEQTETTDMKDERRRKSKSGKDKDNVVLREICQKTTKGIRISSFLDTDSSSTFAPQAAYLYSIAQKISPGKIEFGVCFIDTTIGAFNIGQFTDDKHLSRLRTLFSHNTPVQILVEKGKLEKDLDKLLNSMPSVRIESLTKESEFWGSKKTLKYMAESELFNEKTGDVKWPEEFDKLFCETDGLRLTPNDAWELGWKCFGAMIWYLEDCLVANDLLSLNRFHIYRPLDRVVEEESLCGDAEMLCEESLVNVRPRYMVLDSMTLKNLNVSEGTGSLFSILDGCCTLFGKRLLHKWVCMPLTNPQEINDRLDAVSAIIKHQSLIKEKITPELKVLPDLERLLSKVHSLGSLHRAKSHPDSRAVFFEDKIYSKRKINDLLAVIRGFKTCKKIIEIFENLCNDGESKLLEKLVEDFPKLEDLLSYFFNSFNHETAVKEGVITPKRGADADYDNACQRLLDLEDEGKDLLRQYSRELGAQVKFFGSDKKRFQLEVGENVKVPKSFEVSSSKKGARRYTTEETRAHLSEVQRAEAERGEIIKDITRRIFARFDENREIWAKTVGFIATLDVLFALGSYSSSQEGMTRPIITPFTTTPSLIIENGRHPCLALENYIPNSVTLGGNESNGSFLLLSGPNMGGKSTLMRQVGLLSILAHIGCYVPAERCEMSSVDRIFTRIGAQDNISEGESTFYVEMSETAAILRHSTESSLVLIDELGRGTSTYDGTSIAYSVSKKLAGRGCRTLFSTHYHNLVDSVRGLPSIQLGHMACLVENENEEDPTEEKITFLYKMEAGACPKSYGFNVAKLAGMPTALVQRAHQKAKELEAEVALINRFRGLFATRSA